jgi:hypothetical protein
MHRASDGSCRVQRGLAGRAGHAEAPGTAKCCPYAADGVESAVAIVWSSVTSITPDRLLGHVDDRVFDRRLHYLVQRFP